MTLKDSQKSLLEHSEVKVRLLKLYLESYLSILSNSQHIGNIHIFDLFCGQGIYEDGGEGSPIVILNSIRDAFFSSNSKKFSRKFNCHFNDSDSHKVDHLKAIVDQKELTHKEIGTFSFAKEDYRVLVPKVIKKLNAISLNERAFIFIDPYGYKDLQFSDIKDMLSNGKSEVLLFLPTQFMFRFEKGGTPKALFNFINELVPVDKWPKSSTGLDFIETLKNAFRTNLGSKYFVDSFIISRGLNQFFCLFFFTGHILGFEKMLEAKWKLDKEDGLGWHFRSEGDLFDLIEKEPNTKKFEESLLEFLKSTRTNGEIYLFTLQNGYLCSHANQILKLWQKSNKIDVTNIDGTISRKGAFYLNYKNYTNNSNRINIKVR
ncbi:MAG: three-Cys-motif partner protein TcmP [Bdellovibrio sp.]|nr:three-Cys-motif partner protein TcmP [Bdellovibrio sp.]